jgi:hypothetical protein
MHVRFDPDGVTGCPYRTRNRRARCLRWVHQHSHPPYYKDPQDTLREIRHEIIDCVVPYR